MGMKVNRHTISFLSCIIDRTSFADDAYLDLSGIIEAFLDFVGNVAGKAACSKLVDLFGFHDDAYLATGLDSERLLYADERVRDTLQCLQAFDVEIDSLATSARTSRRNGICRLHNSSLQGLRLSFCGMVRNHSVNDLGRFAKTAGDFTADDSVGSF